MNVLQIANGLYGNKLYFNLFNHLKELGVECLIYAPQKFGFTYEEDFDEKYRNLEEYIYSPGCFSEVDRFFFVRKEKKILKKLLENYIDVINSIDLIHAHTIFSNGYIAYKLNEKYGIPYIVAVRNTDINVFFKYRVNLRKLGRKILNNAEKVVFLSQTVRDAFIKNYIKDNDKEKIFNKSIIIPNGVNDFWLKNKTTHLKQMSGKNIKLIYVGEINANKNVKQTIRVCKELMCDGYNVRFIVVGKCKNKFYKRLLNEKFIEYHNFCGKEELINYYNEADIFVMPSRRETFGIVYSEALTQGLPVIYTRGQGFDGQFIEGHVGYSVDDKSIEEIKHAILKVRKNYECLAKNIMSIKNNFDWEFIANRYLGVYKEAKCRRDKI